MITYNYGNSHSPITLLQMVGDHDLPGIENEIREIHRLTDQEFAFVAVKVENWNHDLSPWNAPAVFGTEDFGDGAENTLEEVLQLCTDNDRKYCIGGYSMTCNACVPMEPVEPSMAICFIYYYAIYNLLFGD